MSRRQKILLVVAVLVLILAIILALLLLRPAEQTPFADTGAPQFTEQQPGVLQPSGGGTTPVPVAPSPVVTTPVTPPPPPDDTNTLRSLAMSFTERFGSYSNQGGYDGILDLKFFMTPSVAEWVDGYVADLEAGQEDPSLYAAVTTRALAADVESLNENAGTATVRVKTQRQQFSPGALDAEIVYQDIVLGFVKTGSAWKVDDVRWQTAQAEPSAP